MGRDTQQSGGQLSHIRLGEGVKRKNCQLATPSQVQDAAL